MRLSFSRQGVCCVEGMVSLVWVGCEWHQRPSGCLRGWGWVLEMCGFGIEVLVEVLMNNRKPKTGLPSFKKKKKMNVGPPKPFVIFISPSIIWKRDRFIRLIWGINTVRAPRDEPSDVIYYVLYQVRASGCSEKAHGLQPLKAEGQLERAVHKERSHHGLELRWLFGPLCPMQSDFADWKKKPNKKTFSF